MQDICKAALQAGKPFAAQIPVAHDFGIGIRFLDKAQPCGGSRKNRESVPVFFGKGRLGKRVVVNGSVAKPVQGIQGRKALQTAGVGAVVVEICLLQDPIVLSHGLKVLWRAIEETDQVEHDARVEEEAWHLACPLPLLEELNPACELLHGSRIFLEAVDGKKDSQLIESNLPALSQRGCSRLGLVQIVAPKVQESDFFRLKPGTINLSLVVQIGKLTKEGVHHACFHKGSTQIEKDQGLCQGCTRTHPVKRKVRHGKIHVACFALDLGGGHVFQRAQSVVVFAEDGKSMVSTPCKEIGLEAIVRKNPGNLG